MTALARTRSAALPLDPEGSIRLLKRVLAGVPMLPDAACRGQHELFDPPSRDESRFDAAERHEIATDICRQCPVLAECRAWASRTRPARRPGGVIAGSINPPSRQEKP